MNAKISLIEERIVYNFLMLILSIIVIN